VSCIIFYVVVLDPFCSGWEVLISYNLWYTALQHLLKHGDVNLPHWHVNEDETRFDYVPSLLYS